MATRCDDCRCRLWSCLLRQFHRTHPVDPRFTSDVELLSASWNSMLKVSATHRQAWQEQMAQISGYQETIFTSPPRWWSRPTAVSVSVCLFVCLSTCQLCSRISKTTRPNFTTFSVRVTCGRGSVLHWRQCNTLCTSSFVDDVTFSHNGANWPESKTTLCFFNFARWRHQSYVRQRYFWSSSQDGSTVGEVVVCDIGLEIWGEFKHWK